MRNEYDNPFSRPDSEQIEDRVFKYKLPNGISVYEFENPLLIKDTDGTEIFKGTSHIYFSSENTLARNSHTAESTTSTVGIPSDEMKGRIIGREGRNIRAFEKETGVDVIIDDTPGVVVVSGFDPVRREVARAALNKLISDGRIHPSRIEEVVGETRAEVEHFIKYLLLIILSGGSLTVQI